MGSHPVDLAGGVERLLHATRRLGGGRAEELLEGVLVALQECEDRRVGDPIPGQLVQRVEIFMDGSERSTAIADLGRRSDFGEPIVELRREPAVLVSPISTP